MGQDWRPTWIELRTLRLLKQQLPRPLSAPEAAAGLAVNLHTVRSVLRRLERGGLVSSEIERLPPWPTRPPRLLFSMTEAGHTALRGAFAMLELSTPLPGSI